MSKVQVCHIFAYCIQKKKKHRSKSMLSKYTFFFEKEDSLLQMEAKCAAEDELPYIQSSSSHCLYFSWDFNCLIYVSQVSINF